MPIKSYLVHPEEGKKEQLVATLNKVPFCEVNPSTSHDVIVLVTDTPTVADEKSLANQLESISEIKNMALVSGFDV